MSAPPRKLGLALAAVIVVVIGTAGALYLTVRRPEGKERDTIVAVDQRAKDDPYALDYGSEIGEKAKAAAADVSNRLKPVISWKLRMLRYMGWY